MFKNYSIPCFKCTPIDLFAKPYLNTNLKQFKKEICSKSTIQG
jgi:hypothetical protein